MNCSGHLRGAHRWISIAFTPTVIANFVARAQAPGGPPLWLTYAPLLPLGLLLLTGLQLFAVPYLGRRHARHGATEPGAPVA